MHDVVMLIRSLCRDPASDRMNDSSVEIQLAIKVAENNEFSCYSWKRPKSDRKKLDHEVRTFPILLVGIH